jgi:hypothetical protein
MSASAWRFYNEGKKYLLKADIDLDSALLRVKLVKGTAAANVSNYTRSTFASITGAPSNIKTPHPQSVSGAVVTALNGSATQKFDINDPVFQASGGDATSVQYAVIGLSGSKALCWTKLSTAAFSITNGNTFKIVVNPSGVFKLLGGTT